MNAPFLTVGAPGANITTSSTSASAAIPNGTAGERPRFIRVHATVAAYVRLGQSGLTAVAGDMIIDPSTPVILNVAGHTHIAAIQVSGAGIVNVTPLGD